MGQLDLERTTEAIGSAYDVQPDPSDQAYCDEQADLGPVLTGG